MPFSQNSQKKKIKKKNINFHIFIASCYEGINIHVPRLIKNILAVNIPVNIVHFIVGGCPINKVYYQNGIEIVNVQYRCFEFTPHIYIINNKFKYNFDYAFLTHDTVKFGKNFYNTILSDSLYLKTIKKDSMKIEHDLPSMNIGIYSKNIILKSSDTLRKLSLNSNDKHKLMELKHKLTYYEDFILNKNPHITTDNCINTNSKLIGITGFEVPGVIKCCKRIDFIKYQSNAGSIRTIDVLKIE